MDNKANTPSRSRFRSSTTSPTSVETNAVGVPTRAIDPVQSAPPCLPSIPSTKSKDLSHENVIVAPLAKNPARLLLPRSEPAPLAHSAHGLFLPIEEGDVDEEYEQRKRRTDRYAPNPERTPNVSIPRIATPLPPNALHRASPPTAMNTSVSSLTGSPLPLLALDMLQGTFQSSQYHADEQPSLSMKISPTSSRPPWLQ